MKLSLGPIATSLVIALAVVGCANASPDASASEGASAQAADALEANVRAVSADLERATGGGAVLVLDRFADRDLRSGPGGVLTGDARRLALRDCAIYGGGLRTSLGPDDDLEDPAKYLDPTTKDALAAKLDAAIGKADVRRIDSFGIGDPGDDFSATCTLAVRTAHGDLLMIQGHGTDRAL